MLLSVLYVARTKDAGDMATKSAELANRPDELGSASPASAWYPALLVPQFGLLVLESPMVLLENNCYTLEFPFNWKEESATVKNHA